MSANVIPRGISSRRKSPITSPWLVGLHLLARDHDQVAAAGELDRLERAAEDVVVGDRDRAEPLASAWSTSASGSIEQSCDQRVCMWRSTTIQSRSASGSPSRGRAGAPAPVRLDVDALELSATAVEARGRDSGTRSASASRRRASRPRRGAGPRRPRARAAPATPCGSTSAQSAGRSLVAQRAQPLGRGDDDRRVAQEVGARLAPRGRADVDAVAQAERDRRTRRERRGAQQDRLPAVEVAERAEHRPDDGQAPGRGLDDDQVVASSQRARTGRGRRRRGRRCTRPGNRAAARSATSSPVASSRSIRASRRSRWFLRGGKPSRSGVDEAWRRSSSGPRAGPHRRAPARPGRTRGRRRSPHAAARWRRSRGRRPESRRRRAARREPRARPRRLLPARRSGAHDDPRGDRQSGTTARARRRCGRARAAPRRRRRRARSCRAAPTTRKASRGRSEAARASIVGAGTLAA